MQGGQNRGKRLQFTFTPSVWIDELKKRTWSLTKSSFVNQSTFDVLLFPPSEFVLLPKSTLRFPFHIPHPFQRTLKTARFDTKYLHPETNESLN